MNTKIWDLNAAGKPHAEWACFFPHMAGCQTSSKSHAHHPLASLASTWDACPLMVSMGRRASQCTMRFGSTAKVLAKCKLKYCRISECSGGWAAAYGREPQPHHGSHPKAAGSSAGDGSLSADRQTHHAVLHHPCCHCCSTCCQSAGCFCKAEDVDSWVYRRLR